MQHACDLNASDSARCSLRLLAPCCLQRTWDSASNPSCGKEDHFLFVTALFLVRLRWLKSASPAKRRVRTIGKLGLGSLKPRSGDIVLGATTARFLVDLELALKVQPRVTGRHELTNSSGSTTTFMGAYVHVYGCVQLQETRWLTLRLRCGY